MKSAAARDGSVYDPEVSGKIEDRTERRGVLGSHGFAMVMGAVGGVAAFAAIGAALGGVVIAIVLAFVGAGVGALAGRLAATALRPTALDRSQIDRLGVAPIVHDR